MSTVLTGATWLGWGGERERWRGKSVTGASVQGQWACLVKPTHRPPTGLLSTVCGSAAGDHLDIGEHVHRAIKHTHTTAFVLHSVDRSYMEVEERTDRKKMS